VNPREKRKYLSSSLGVRLCLAQDRRERKTSTGFVKRVRRSADASSTWPSGIAPSAASKKGAAGGLAYLKYLRDHPLSLAADAPRISLLREFAFSRLRESRAASTFC
jgi:hypothetical protein